MRLSCIHYVSLLFASHTVPFRSFRLEKSNRWSGLGSLCRYDGLIDIMVCA